MKVGQICVKISGREANKKCVIVDIVDDTFVLIDGNVRRRKCNVKHLEPLDKVLKISKKASTAKVHEAMKKEKIEVIVRKQKKITKKVKPQRKRKVKNDGK